MSYYDVINKIKTHFEDDPLINQITQGMIDDVDLQKTSFFPIAHVMVNSVVPEQRILRYNMTIFAMDIVDFSKSKTTDVFNGNDNEIEVLNSMLEVLIRFYELGLRGSLRDDSYDIENPNCEPFTERFENHISGWALTFDLLVQNDMTIC